MCEKDKLTMLDLSCKQLKKVPKQIDAQNICTLILDENQLQKLDNIDYYMKIEKLSVSKNQLLRMYGICRLNFLQHLDLSFNGILSIEGLRDCIHLRHLNLEGNSIKTIEHLQNNIQLEYLNLAENAIGNIVDISFLRNLKELYLHSNRLTHLRLCDKYLPLSLEILTLAKNKIIDLNEICTLTHLSSLNSLTIGDNPCVSMTAGTDGFDYRPFVLNWCMSLKTIDGFVVDPIESLKAEWLYSQGRGRSFRVGEQAALAKHLSAVCPLTGKALENENERKLRLILSKAQHHQRQLQEEKSESISNPSVNSSPSSGRKKSFSRLQSPRFSRLSGRQGSPDSMTNSYHGNIISEQSNSTTNQMTTSLIENIKNESSFYESLDGSLSNSPNSKSLYYQDIHKEQRLSTTNSHKGGPLNAASKMVPVPETLISPDTCPSNITHHLTLSSNDAPTQNQQQIKLNKNSLSTRSPLLKRITDHSTILSPRKFIYPHSNKITIPTTVTQQLNIGDNDPTNNKIACNSTHIFVREDSPVQSSDNDSDINIEKLKTIRNKAAQKCQELKIKTFECKYTSDINTSAVIIQKMWRGYRTRKKNKHIAEKLLQRRTEEYIDKLSKDMEMTKIQLENERKIQQLQMQAINALWKKVSCIQNCHTNAFMTNDNVIKENHELNTVLPSTVSMVSLDNSSSIVVTDLTKTCSMLTKQVQQLQCSMRDILNCLTLFCNLPQEHVKLLLTNSLENGTFNDDKQLDCIGTQTEIIAVKTPQIENFPFSPRLRPSTLPLTESTKVLNSPTTESHIADNIRVIDETFWNNLQLDKTSTKLHSKSTPSTPNTD